MFSKIVLCGVFSVAAALHPVVPPTATQDLWQASMPNEIVVNYDVPASFLKEIGSTDAFFSASANVAAEEASYQKILASLKHRIDTHFAGMGSFLSAPRDTQVNIFVDSHPRGKRVDATRLRADAFSYARKNLDSLTQ